MKDVAFPKSAARHGVQEYETRVLPNLQAAPIPSDSRQAPHQKRGGSPAGGRPRRKFRCHRQSAGRPACTV